MAASPEFGPLQGVTSRVSVGPGGAQANNESAGVAVSADGRYVAFSSYASNLVAGDTDNTLDSPMTVRATSDGVTANLPHAQRVLAVCGFMFAELPDRCHAGRGA